MPFHRPAVPPKFISRQVAEARRFYLNLRPAATEGITVICGGWERSAADYRIQRASFPFLSVEYVAGGVGAVTLGEQTHVLGPGAFYAYGPDVPHTISTDPEKRLSKYFVNYVGTRALALMDECGLGPGTFRAVAAGDEVQKAFEDLLRAGQRGVGASERLVALHLEILLLTVAEAGMPARSSAQRAFQTFKRCQRYLEEHFENVATVEQAAAACHVDVAYFCRLFARFDRQTPYGFLQRLKMNQAASLLETSRFLIREVADRMRMDPFHFSRAFKRVHGLSPTAFLKHRLQQDGS
jgi:AraC-like DNA-binding protein